MFSDVSLKRWTISARDCYFRGCVCLGCPTYKILETKCRMKQTVLELVRKFGKPEKEISYQESEE